MPVSCCKSRFWGLATLSVGRSTCYVGILGLPAAFMPPCQLGLFHPPVPPWRTSSCQSKFAFIRAMTGIVGEPLISFLGRPSSRRRAWSRRAPAPHTLNLLSHFALNFHFLHLILQPGSEVAFLIIAVAPQNPPPPVTVNSERRPDSGIMWQSWSGLMAPHFQINGISNRHGLERVR